MHALLVLLLKSQSPNKLEHSYKNFSNVSARIYLNRRKVLYTDF